MTDEDLIRLLDERPPAEWSVAELAQLRERWSQSEPLRLALANHLREESALASVLGDVHVAPADIVARAARYRSGRRAIWTRGLFGLVLLLAAGSAATWYVMQPPQQVLVDQPPAPSTVSNAAPDAPTLPPSGDPTTGDPVLVAEAPANEPTEPTEPTSTPAAEPGGDSTVSMAAAPEIPPGPWHKALTEEAAWPADAPRWSFADVYDQDHLEIPAPLAAEWFSSLPDAKHEWFAEQIGNRPMPRFEGTARLRPPMLDDAVLRITPFDIDRLAIYFWTGDEGVELRYYPYREPRVWVANRIRRADAPPLSSESEQAATDNRLTGVDVSINEGSNLRIRRLQLLATDGGRYHHLGAGRLELRCGHGQLHLSRGGRVLLAAPLASPCQAIDLSGRLRIRGLSMVRAEAWPTTVPLPVQSLTANVAAADLPWQLSAIDRGDTTSHAGSIALRGTARDHRATLTLPFAPRETVLPTGGFHEVVLQLGRTDVGTGLELQDEAGRSVARLSIALNEPTKSLALEPIGADEHRDHAYRDPQNEPPTLIAPGSWLKLLIGWRTWQVLVSSDGVHWGHLGNNDHTRLERNVARLALFCEPGEAPRSIELRQLQIHRLTALDAFAAPELIARVPHWTDDELRQSTLWFAKAGATYAALTDAERETISLGPWQAACAVSAIHQGAPRDSFWLWTPVFDAVCQSGAPRPEKLAALELVAAVSDLWEDDRASTWITQYTRVIDAERLHDRAIISLPDVMTSVARAPLWTRQVARTALDELAAVDLLNVVAARRWDEVGQLAPQMRYWFFAPHPDDSPRESSQRLEQLARWSLAIGAEERPSLSLLGGSLPVEWRPPLIARINKEAYNLRAELSGALAGDSLEDACRILTSADVSAWIDAPRAVSPGPAPERATDDTAEGAFALAQTPSLLPDETDSRLRTTFPVAIAAAMQDHPGFQQELRERFADTGQVRVQEMMRRGDASDVEAITLQFFGTRPAALAHRWLADRCLSGGDAGSAWRHYQAARESLAADDPLLPDVIVRQELAAVLANLPPSDDQARVAAGELSIDAGAVATDVPPQISEFVASRQTGASAQPSEEAFRPEPLSAALPVGQYKLQPVTMFDGQSGQNAGRAEAWPSDIFGRQMTAVVAHDQLIVSNRFQVTAYEWPTGTTKWSLGLGGDQGEAFAWPAVPMAPLVAGDHVYVRRLTKAAPELIAVNRRDGTIAWTAKNFIAASDPVLVGPHLGVVAVSIREASQAEQMWNFSWLTLDRQTGAIESELPLATTYGPRNVDPVAMVSSQGDQAVATVPGAAIGFSQGGTLNWVRKLLWVPAAIDPAAPTHQPTAPVWTAIAGRPSVLLVQPSARATMALDATSGRLHWEFVDAQLQRLCGTSTSLVLTASKHELVALDPQRGTPLWRSPIPERLDATLCGESQSIVARREFPAGQAGRVVLVWLDNATGVIVAEVPLDMPATETPQLGPWLSAGASARPGFESLVFLGRGRKETRREILRLIPQPIATARRTR